MFTKIVIIEDDLAIQQLYELKLKLEGYQVRLANDGQEGLELIESFRPDIILLDLRMPVMSGDEMLMRLRREEWGADIRVIVLTNISKDEAPPALRFLHVDRYMVKAHHTPAQVVQVVQEVLDKNAS